MIKRMIGLLGLLGLVSGCFTSSVAPDPSILRVGVSPDSRPIIFEQSGKIMGIEADFARKLGAELHRKIVFVKVPWDKQIDYLEQNKTDIIMSGMTITLPRSMRVEFCAPYLQSGMTGLFRRNSYNDAGLVSSVIINQGKKIGAIKDTTGELFVIRNFPRSEKIYFSNADKAVEALKRGKIDMFIHDAPIIWWLSAQNESSLVAFPELLNTEPLAWAVQKNNTKLRDQVNAALLKWAKDGSRKKVVDRWIPLAR